MDNVLWRVFHVTVLIFAYFKTVSYYFCVFGIESTRNWRITNMFYFVYFGVSFVFCLSLFEILNQGKMPPGKIVSWKKAS